MLLLLTEIVDCYKGCISDFTPFVPWKPVLCPLRQTEVLYLLNTGSILLAWGQVACAHVGEFRQTIET